MAPALPSGASKLSAGAHERPATLRRAARRRERHRRLHGAGGDRGVALAVSAGGRGPGAADRPCVGRQRRGALARPVRKLRRGAPAGHREFRQSDIAHAGRRCLASSPEQYRGKRPRHRLHHDTRPRRPRAGRAGHGARYRSCRTAVLQGAPGECRPRAAHQRSPRRQRGSPDHRAEPPHDPQRRQVRRRRGGRGRSRHGSRAACADPDRSIGFDHRRIRERQGHRTQAGSAR